jgi:hypothetical protein
MCLVEVEKSAKPVAACAMPVMNVSSLFPHPLFPLLKDFVTSLELAESGMFG